MDRRVQKKIKRDDLDKIMEKYPSLNTFLEELSKNKKDPELTNIVQASITDIF